MAIKAIMCDVDGTLLNSQGVVSPYTIEQIKKIKAQAFCLVWRRAGMCIVLKINWSVGALTDSSMRLSVRAARKSLTFC